MLTIFLLLIAFQVKHVLADYFLQAPWMVTGKGDAEGWRFVVPLLAHAEIHAIGTLLITAAVNRHLFWLAFIDLALHFGIDRLKAGPKYFGRFNDPRKPSFWRALGCDQMAHHLCHYAIIATLVLWK